jgi:hypothetical protein
MPRRSKEVLAQQKADAERERAQVPVKAKAAALPAAADSRSPREKYLDDIAPSGVVGRLIKFSKEGQFVFLDDESTISPDEDFVALVDQTLVSWVRFHDGEPPERIGGLLYQGFELPPREQMGDTNRATWSIGLSGQPEDPWKHEMMLVLKRPVTLELATFATTSKTGRRAVGNLLRHYDRLQHTETGAFPVVRLRPGGFNHSDARIGWVPVPTFVAVGVSPGHTAAIPDTSVKSQLNDEIPF